MHSHLLPAREKREFGRMTADILCIQVFFAKCFQFWFAQNKKGHFASSIERPLNEVRVKRVCKSCILEHSDNRLLDHNRNLQKSYLKKYTDSSLTALNTFLQIWNSSEALESNCCRKCLWNGCARAPFLSINSKLLLFTFKLLFLSDVFHCCKRKRTSPKAERQTIKFNSCHLLFIHARRFT